MIILSNDYPSSIPGESIHPSGGTARFARDFSQIIANSGNTWVGILRDYEEKIIDNGNIKHITILKNTKSTSEFLLSEESLDPYVYFSGDISRICDIIASQKVTTVFLNGAYTFTWILYAAAKKMNIPCITQHAGIFAMEVKYRPNGFSERGREISNQMVADIAEYSKVNIFLNEFSLEKFKELSIGLVTNPIIIPLPYGDGGYPENYFIKNAERLHIGCVARWDTIKNHEAIISLAEEVRSQALNWEISVVTSIPNTPIKAETKAHYRSIVSIIEPMNSKELMGYYSKNDIMILPSNFDVSPTVVLEALHAGVPTIISPNVGWKNEYAKSGMQDWVIDFSDAKKVVERIKQITESSPWGEVAKFAKKISTQHENAKIYQEYLSLFLEKE